MIPAVKNLPRTSLGVFPTPLVEAKHLSSFLGGPRIFIKREDLSGLALGGNKCRKIEFIMAEAKKQGADAVVGTAGSQSNFCLTLAAAARKLGMKPACVVIKGVHNEMQGNLLLHEILGSEVEMLANITMEDVNGSVVSDAMEKVASDLRARGYRPFITRHAIPDISALLSVVGSIDTADELTTQLREQNIDAQYLVVANHGGGTQAGLILGSKYLQASYKVIGMSVVSDIGTARADVIEKTDAVSDFLKLSVKVTADELEIYDSYRGEGYGVVTRECLDAIRLLAQTEGIFLDPVYTGKTMAGLIDKVKKGRFSSTDTVVFLHTGGIPVLFAYHKELANATP
jgi:1-aminocyclopropane-1-carboxylate deaminase/D-cysteine desulfhydrase-like pyridoxal-dependent ACC family enzyme